MIGGVKAEITQDPPADKPGVTYGPYNGIDNDINTIFYSKEEHERWNPIYRIELATPSQVHRVVITNRNTKGWRFKHAEVRVGYSDPYIYGMDTITDNILCADYLGPAENGEKIILNCDGFIDGKFVIIHLKSNLPLHFAEVEVFGQGKMQ